jgi:hypothetical protein
VDKCLEVRHDILLLIFNYITIKEEIISWISNERLKRHSFRVFPF